MIEYDDEEHDEDDESDELGMVDWFCVEGDDEVGNGGGRAGGFVVDTIVTRPSWRCNVPIIICSILIQLRRQFNRPVQQCLGGLF